ncbi:MAG: VanZ family protein [candidate division WOR-3 bacterium]
MFYFSGAEWGGQRTALLIEAILRFLAPSLLEQLSRAQIQLLNWVVRKSAHLLEYTLLALLSYHAWCKGARVSPSRALLLAFLCTVGYALFDELHQARVPTRSALASDVLIDTLGAVLGCWLIRRWRSRRGAVQ